MEEEDKEFRMKMEELREHFGDLICEDTLRVLTSYSLGRTPKFNLNEVLKFGGKAAIKGRILKNYGVKSFSNSKGAGIVGNALIGLIDKDKSDVRQIKAVFWNDAARILNDVSEGDILRVEGYLKKNQDEIELSVNQPSKVEILEKNTAEVEFTPILKIEPLVQTSIKGRISGFGDVKNFKKRMLAELYISDDTGRVRLIMWDDKVSIYRKADIGDVIEVLNGYPKVGWDGEMEVHCGWNCTITLKRA